MRTLLAVVLISSCQSPTHVEVDGGSSHTWPARTEAAPQISIYGEVNNAKVATQALVFALALGDAYPQVVTVRPSKPTYLIQGCSRATWGEARWSAITGLRGDAARLSIVDGALQVEIDRAGDMAFALEGEVTGVECTVGAETLTQVSLRNDVVLHVSAVSGFVVSHFAQDDAECADRVLLATSRSHQPPRITALDSHGRAFKPLNAPEPVAMTLRSDQPLFVGDTEVQLPRGKTSIELDTTLPVRGLRVLEAVDSSSVTQATLKLQLMRATLKGATPADLTDGATFPIWHPEENNYVAVNYERITTTRGVLCSPPGEDWFEATSETPSTCAVDDLSYDKLASYAVAKVLAAGECRLQVGIVGTQLTWPARFTTTP